MEKVVLIDADSLVYKNIEDLNEYKDRIDEIFSQIIQDTKATHYRIFLETPGNYTFRKALFSDYKANRANKELPFNFREIKEYMIETYNPLLSIGVETDDTIISTNKFLKDNYPLTDVVIAANDKDYQTYQITYYDLYYNRFGEIKNISKEEADFNFWLQMAMGDGSDNVKAIPNIGKVKATKLLKDSKNLFMSVYRQYNLVYGRKSREYFIKAYTLLKLRDNVKPCRNFDRAVFSEE